MSQSGEQMVIFSCTVMSLSTTGIRWLYYKPEIIRGNEMYYMLRRDHSPCYSYHLPLNGSNVYCLPLVDELESPATVFDSKLTTPQVPIFPPVKIFLNLGFWSVWTPRGDLAMYNFDKTEFWKVHMMG